MRYVLMFAFVLAATMTPAHAQRTPRTPYDIEALHPDVRASVLLARSNAERGETAADAAREAAASAELAAERARNGEPGYRAYFYESDPQQRRYEGEWMNERASGLGVLSFAGEPYAGDRYAGNFLYGRKYGLGVYTYSALPTDESRSRYEGDYVSGEAERYGVYYGRYGNRHAGRSGRDGFNGEGVYDHPNGERYEGNFVNNRRHGLGVLWRADGRVRQSGYWVEGRFTTRLRPERTR